MPDLIRHPEAGGAGSLDSCLRRNDERLHSIVICSSVTERELSVHRLVNEHRAAQGLTPLALSPEISAIARAHSEDMASGRVGVGHDGFGRRSAQSGGAAENVAFNRTDRGAVSSWSCDALGNPTGFHLTPGHAADLAGVEALLPPLLTHVHALLADKAYDAQERVIDPLEQAAVTVVIPPKANRLQPRPYDKPLYQARHLIENFFAQLKHYRALATRYDKRAVSSLGAIYLAASVVLLN